MTILQKSQALGHSTPLLGQENFSLPAPPGKEKILFSVTSLPAVGRCASVVKANNFVLCLRCPVEDVFEFLNDVGEGGGCEGEEEGEKGKARNEFSLPIERSFVIQGGRMSKTEKNDKDKEKKPSGIVKNGNKTHHGYGQ